MRGIAVNAIIQLPIIALTQNIMKIVNQIIDAFLRQQLATLKWMEGFRSVLLVKHVLAL